MNQKRREEANDRARDPCRDGRNGIELGGFVTTAVKSTADALDLPPPQHAAKMLRLAPMLELAKSKIPGISDSFHKLQHHTMRPVKPVLESNYRRRARWPIFDASASADSTIEAALPADLLARGRAITLRLSIKEAIYKAVAPTVRRYVGFLEVDLVDNAVATTIALPLTIEAHRRKHAGHWIATARAAGRTALCARPGSVVSGVRHTPDRLSSERGPLRTGMMRQRWPRARGATV